MPPAVTRESATNITSDDCGECIRVGFGQILPGPSWAGCYNTAVGRLRVFLSRLGWAGRLFLLLAVLWLPVRLLAPGSALRLLLETALVLAGLAAGLIWTHRVIRKAIWRLRNRLVVAYLFIAVVPLALVLALTAIGAYILIGQMALFLLRTELEHRSEALLDPAVGLAATPPQRLEERLRWLAPYFRERYPGLQFLVRHNRVYRDPDGAPLDLPPNPAPAAAGILSHNGRHHLWAHAAQQGVQVDLVAPVTARLLESVAPGIGEITLADLLPGHGGAAPARIRAGSLPPPRHRFDLEVRWFTLVPVAGQETPATLSIATRPSAVLGLLFGGKMDFMQGFWGLLLVSLAILFLVFVLVALAIGISITRTITRAVHGLYEGTRRVMEGDFAHRIEVRGSDQLAELGSSFNRMTENLERLLRVEKEKERLQSEIEIAREVQNQLYPKQVPMLRRLELMATCNPARMVSGDYYDYLSLDGSKVALAIGDVAGKGISAALLMATVQASLRTQVKSCLESSAAGHANGSPSTARLVTLLNQQLYAFTAPEKFATFCFAVYDDDTGVLTYTNAGHPPPVLVRGNRIQRLDTNGMVVGAFPFATYGESRLLLEDGDLLVWFTDGITEAENEYGEMFGEERLCELLLKHAWRDPQEIMETVLEAVIQWTAQPDAMDDMTLLVARRVQPAEGETRQ